MQHTIGILTGRVNGAVDRKPRRVDIVRTVEYLFALQIHLNQTGGSYFTEHHSVWVDEEMMFRSGNADRNVGEDQIVPAEHRHQAVAGRQVNPLLPFRGVDG